MEQLFEIGIFVAKALIIVLSLIAVIMAIAAAASQPQPDKQLDIEDLNEKFSDYESNLKSKVLPKKAFKKEQKLKKKKKKQPEKKNLFVLNFKGDIQASQVESFREEITALLSVATKEDEVLINVESPGGVVHGYGLAAAQILRLKKAGMHVTVAVDKVAASGGYMMACTANKIIAAPFAILGSIGVIAQVPNIHRLLKKHDVDYQEITSGEYKRTVSLMGEITEKGKEKFTEQIEDTHALFKEFVGRERPQVDMEKAATGEYWFAHRAIDLKLVDEIMTSDEFLFSLKDSRKIIQINLLSKKNLSQKLQKLVGQLGSKVLESKFSVKRFLETGI